jgi:hypothetical protein
MHGSSHGTTRRSPVKRHAPVPAQRYSMTEVSAHGNSDKLLELPYEPAELCSTHGRREEATVRTNGEVASKRNQMHSGVT